MNNKEQPQTFASLLPARRKLYGRRIFLRRLGYADAPALREYLLKNRDWLKPWSPPIPPRLALKDVKIQISRSRRELRQARRLEFGIFEISTGKLIGKISLHTLIFGVAWCAGLGYSVSREFGGRGFMKEAVATAVSFAFEEIGLHRVWAGVQPRNHFSIRLLETLGFVKDGMHRSDIFIDGEWRAQQYFSLLREEYDQIADRWIENRWLGCT